MNSKDLKKTDDGISQPKRANMLLPILFLWGFGIIFLFGYFIFDEGITETFGEYYLIPWALLAGAIILSPGIYLFYKGKFDLFHPLVYGVWSYMFPAFIIGAFIITYGYTNSYVLLFVTEPEYNIPLALIYVIIGYLGLIVGFYLPFGKFFVNKMDKFVPTAKWNPDDIWLPGIALIFAGLAINIIGILQGVLGFQRIDEIGAFDSLVSFLTVFFILGYILLWLGIFQTKRRDGLFFIMLFFLLALIPFRLFMQGGRSSLGTSVIFIAFAFWYSGRRLKWQHSAIFGAIFIAAIFVGIIYGTTFRQIKGSEERINAGEYVEQVFETIDYISRKDTTIILEDGVRNLAERIENLSSLAVVVANYEKLEPYEESYGLKNNIYNDFVTSFIPRFIWSDKPPTSDPRAYSDLYFDYGESSFAMTPFGDLLRNFGVIGIPLGMLIFGFYFRIIYSYLIDTNEPRIWKKVAYYPLLTVVSYEAFYGIFFPTLIRTLPVVAISLIVAGFFVRKTKTR